MTLNTNEIKSITNEFAGGTSADIHKRIQEKKMYNKIVDDYVVEDIDFSISEYERVFKDSKLNENIASDEYRAQNGDYYKNLKEEYWYDNPLKFTKDEKTGSYLIEQQDENGNWVGMGWTTEEAAMNYMYEASNGGTQYATQSGGNGDGSGGNGGGSGGNGDGSGGNGNGTGKIPYDPNVPKSAAVAGGMEQPPSSNVPGYAAAAGGSSTYKAPNYGGTASPTTPSTNTSSNIPGAAAAAGGMKQPPSSSVPEYAAAAGGPSTYKAPNYGGTASPTTPTTNPATTSTNTNKNTSSNAPGYAAASNL